MTLVKHEVKILRQNTSCLRFTFTYLLSYSLWQQLPLLFFFITLLPDEVKINCLLFFLYKGEMETLCFVSHIKLSITSMLMLFFLMFLAMKSLYYSPKSYSANDGVSMLDKFQ